MPRKIIPIGVLYRVSTLQQDYEMQKNAIDRFCIEHSNEEEEWKIVKEYTEDGVSAFKNSVFDRKETQEILNDCRKGIFKVFLTFIIDRIGRTGIETAYYIDLIIKTGVEVHSILEGKVDTDTMTGQIMLSVNTSKANDESKKTSFRVNETHRQMVEKNIFRGGTAPYGYKLVRTGELGTPIYNKKKKELMALIKNEEEVFVLQTMKELIFERGYGSNRIAKYLNGHNIPSKTGGKWNSATIRILLRNPILKGYSTYGKNKSKLGTNKKYRQSKSNWIYAEKPNPDWVIYTEEEFNKIQTFIDNKNPNKEKSISIPTKSKLLLTGFIYCGYCGNPLTTTYNYKYWENKDGTKKHRVTSKYRCSGKALNKVKCEGQTIYSKDKIESAVLFRINTFLKSLEYEEVVEEYAKINKDKINLLESKLVNINKKLNETEEEITTLKNEVTKSILGKSSFKPELLNELIEEKTNKKNILSNEKLSLQQEIEDQKFALTKTNDLEVKLPNWEKEFNDGDYEIKKNLLASIIKRIGVYRDSIEIQLNIDLINGVHNTCNRERA